VSFWWSLGCPQKVREYMKTLSEEHLLAFIQSGIKTGKGEDWDGCPLYLDDLIHQEWYWLVPELNAQALELVKEVIDKRFSHPCYRNSTDAMMYPPSYGPEL